MSERDSKSLLKLIKKSQLLDETQMEEVGELANSFPMGTDFMKCLTRKKYLTRWQAGQLMKGLTSFIMGKYRLIDLLGAGGMGRVFRAEHIAMNRPVALKIISKELVSDPVAQKRFLDEARAIAALNHPNIVHAYNIDKEGSRYYIVMEFVKGKDLEKVVREDGIPDQERSVKYVLQVASALDHAHERGMVHCDIKPANLLLNADGQIKVLDMGLARLYGKSVKEQVAEDNAADDSPLLGTIDYMAPEVTNDPAAVSPRSDIYSLGCVFYFLLTGCVPFPGESIPERILKHQTEDATPPAAQNPRVDRRLSDICMKMMAREPEDRYASSAEVVEALTEWLSDQGTGGSSLDFMIPPAGVPAPPAVRKEPPASKKTDAPKKSDSAEDAFQFPDFLSEPSAGPKDSNSTGLHLPGLPGFMEKTHFASVDTSQKRNSASAQEEVDSQNTTKSFHDDSGMLAGLDIKKNRRPSDSTAVLETPAAQPAPLPASLKDSLGNDLSFLPISEGENSLKKGYSAPAKEDFGKKKAKTSKRPADASAEGEPAQKDGGKKQAAKKSLFGGMMGGKKTGKPAAAEEPAAKEATAPAKAPAAKKGAAATAAAGAKAAKTEAGAKNAPAGKGKKGKKGFPVLYTVIGSGVMLLILAGVLALTMRGSGPQNNATSPENEIANGVENGENAEAETLDDNPFAVRPKSPTTEKKNEKKPKKAEGEKKNAKTDVTVADATTEKKTPETTPATSAAVEKTEEKIPTPTTMEKVPGDTPDASVTADSAEKVEEKVEVKTETPGTEEKVEEKKEPTTDEVKPEEKKEPAAEPAATTEPTAPAESTGAAADAEPFKEMKNTLAVKLAMAKESPEISLGTVLANDAPIQVALLGGDKAFPDNKGKKVAVFTLEKHAGADVKKAAWNVIYEPQKIGAKEVDPPQTVAEIQRDGNSLKFVWKPNETVKDKELRHLRNTAVKLTCNDKSHSVGFREPVLLPMAELNFTKKVNLKFTDKELDAMPAASALFFEVQQIKDLDPEKTPFLEKLPKAVSFAEITKKSPLGVQISYTDAANNTTHMADIQVEAMINNNGGLAGSIALVPKNPGFTNILKPPFANALANNSMGVEQYKKWQQIRDNNDEKDETKKRAARDQIWLYETAEKLAAPCTITYCIYMELGGERFDLICADQPLPEPKKKK